MPLPVGAHATSPRLLSLATVAQALVPRGRMGAALRGSAAPPPPSRRRQHRCTPLATTAGGAQQQQQQQQQQHHHHHHHHHPRRRQVVLRSAHVWLLAAAMEASADATTILNSVLGAYGLPQLKATPGFRLYDDPEEGFLFEYPASWVRRKNTLRAGLVISDFNTADKLQLEVLATPLPAGASLSDAAVLKLVNPAAEVGGDSRLEVPPASRVQSEVRQIAGKDYLYLAFPSETITRSGYQVRRKNVAVVAAGRRGAVYVLGASARSDQYDAAKGELLQHVVDSFRVL